MANYFLTTYVTVEIPDLGGLVFSANTTTNLSLYAKTDEVENSIEHGDLKTILDAVQGVIENDAGDNITPTSVTKIFHARDVLIETIPTYSAQNVQDALQELKNNIGNGTGGGSSSIYNEFLTGLRDGSNKDFTTQRTFVGGTTRVFINGQRQTLGTDYNEPGLRNIQLVRIAPKSWYHLIIDYDI